MHDKNKFVGKYMHIYTPTNITTARQVVHLTTTNCEYFENYITKATEVIFKHFYEYLLHNIDNIQLMSS